jgi:hypothetical protein
MFALKEHVASICFKYFRGMLQVFSIDVAKVDHDVAKVDWDVAHVAMAIHVCSKCFICIRRMLQVFLSGCCKSRSRCCVYMHITSICFKCSRCFIRLLQVFHLDVAYVYNGHWLSSVFLGVVQSVSDICCKCFI